MHSKAQTNMSSLRFLYIFLALILIILFRLRRRTVIPIYWPLVGMMPDLLLQLHRIHDWCTEFLSLTQYSFLFRGPSFCNMDFLITVDPANVHHVMTSNFSNFPKGSEFKQMFDILGDGISNSDSDSWRSQRETAQKLLTRPGFVKFLMKTSHDKVENGLVPVLNRVAEEQLVVDLQDLFQRFTLDSMCMILLGYDAACLSIDFPEVTLSKALDNAGEAILYRHVSLKTIWKLQRWLGIGEEKKLREAWKAIDHIVADIISAKKEQLRQGTKLVTEKDGQSADVLTSYMTDASAPGNKEPDDKFLRDTILSFLIAGRDTSATTLTWFFWLLSKNPEVQAKIREELEGALPADVNNLDHKVRLFDIKELRNKVYLHAALCESLRLYPPVPFQHKSPLRDDILPSGHRVNPKMKILINMYAMGRMRSIWGDDCLEFKPERWITQTGGIKHEPSYKFFAFNAGPRTCLGKEMAFIQMKAAAAAIIYNYHVRVVEEQVISPSVSIILHMKRGLKVGFAKRWAW